MKKICFNSNLIYFFVLVLFVGVRICSAWGVFGFLGDYANWVMAFVLQVGIIFLVPVVLFKFLNKTSTKETFKFFSYRKISIKAVALAVVLGGIIFFLNVYVSSFFNTIIQFFGYKPSTASTTSSLPNTWWVLVLNIVTTAILPAVAEETLHRGMLLKGCSTLGMKRAILISGVLFGLLHLNIEQFFYATLIGVFFGYLCWSCNSIYPCMIVHFMNNALSVVFSFAASKGWAFGNLFGAISNYIAANHFLGFVFFTLLLGLFVTLAVELTRALIRDSFNFNFGRRQKELTNMAIRQSFLRQVENLKNNQNLGKSIYSTENNVIYVDFKDFLDFVNKQIEAVNDKNVENKNENYNENYDENKNENQNEGIKDKYVVNKNTVSNKFAVSDKYAASANPQNLQNQQSLKGVATSKSNNYDLKIKILLLGSFMLSGLITLMTFIWGLFR